MSMHQTISTGNYGNDTVVGKILDGESVARIQDANISVQGDLEFLNIDWFAAWGERYVALNHSNTPVSFLSMESVTGKVLGACPYVLESYFGFKVLSLAGYYYPFRSIIVDQYSIPESTQALVKTLHNSKMTNVVRLGPLEQDAEITQNIEHAFKKQKWFCHKVVHGQQHAVALPDTFEEYKDKLSKKMLGNMRREKNKIRKLGAVRDVKYTGLSAEQWAPVIDDCAQVERNSWVHKADNGKSVMHNEEIFWKRLLQNQETSERTTILITYLDDKPISYNVALDSGDSRYGLSSHFDDEYKKLGVGGATHMLVIEDAIEKGIKKLNMGYAFASYKQRWNAEPTSDLVDYFYFRPNLIGGLLYLGSQLKEFIDDQRPKLNRLMGKAIHFRN